MNLCDGEDAQRRTFTTEQNVNFLKSSLWLKASRSGIQLLELAGSRVVSDACLPKDISYAWPLPTTEATPKASCHGGDG